MVGLAAVGPELNSWNRKKVPAMVWERRAVAVLPVLIGHYCLHKHVLLVNICRT